MGRITSMPLQTEEIDEVFEKLLARIGLDEESIKKQSLDELEDSLVRIDGALANAAAFGILRIQVSGRANAIVTASTTDTHFEYGATTLLLARKKLITDRLRSLRRESPVHDLASLIQTVQNAELRTALAAELDATRLQRTEGTSRTTRKNFAFVAMAMDPDTPELDDVLDAIRDGAARCGVVAERVDDDETNQPITARMLKAIEEAEYVIVDLTAERPNVYYEAGYAHGLGKIPIYAIRAGTPIHFDIKDYPIIAYKNMRSLKDALATRLRRLGAGEGLQR